jgi:pimeloyl-ACP methyl ester carboxylesterase
MTTRLAYTRKGSGEPLVLIHGIGHRRQAWNPVLDRLAETYDVIAVDLAGFGESEPYPAGTDYSMDNACRILAENFAEWGIERPHVAGNSLGGAIALELGARGLARSVTALSPAGFFRHLGDRLQALLLLLVLRVSSLAPMSVLRLVSRSAFGRRIAGLSLYSHPERFDNEAVLGDAIALKQARAFGGTLRAGVHYRFDSPVHVPTTVAWATHDRILRFGQSELARRRLPDAHHVALPHCGHVPMVDDPELVVRVIEQTAHPAG